MSTLRQDPTTRQWVILAPKRETRPHAPTSIVRPVPSANDPNCPFCPGNETQTPTEVLRLPEVGPWSVRVVPNLYAPISGDGAAPRTGEPMLREMPAVGASEVVIESPSHSARMDGMSTQDVGRIVTAWRDRFRTLMERADTRAVVIFKNFGTLAGTSLTHPHSQIVAAPVFLPRLLRRMDVARAHFDAHGTNLYLDIVKTERAAGERIVAERGRFVAMEPWAASTPYETWLLPTQPQGSIGELRDEDVADFAALLGDTLRAIREECGDPDYNLVVSSAPRDGQTSEYFLWHIKILPKIAQPAGFEIGSGMGINTVSPEDAAERLRDALE